MDPTSDTYVVFMSNAVYPNGPSGINAIRGGVANAVATWVRTQPDSGKLAAHLTGYNESIAGGAPLASPQRQRRHRNRRARTKPFRPDGSARRQAWRNPTRRAAYEPGLVLMRTAVLPLTSSPMMRKQRFPGLKLQLLFSPEHGITGALDRPAIEDAKDPSTGLPVISLYGAQRRPSLETLHSLDAVLIDLQDAGVRFYTYDTVVRYFLEAARAVRHRRCRSGSS